MKSVFPATHVLSYEKDGRMVEVLVLRRDAALYVQDEWLGNAVPDWTFEDDGRLYYCGIDYAEERGKCSLRPVGQSRIRLETLLGLVLRGHHDPLLLSQALSRSVEEVETSLATLERLRKLRRTKDGTYVPAFEEALDGKEG